MKTREEISKKDKWNLTRIYKSMAEFEKDFKEVERITAEIVSLKGHIMDSPETLLKFLKLDTEYNQKLTSLYNFAHLKYYEDMTNSENDALRLRCEKLNEDTTVKLSFLRPEMLKTDYKPLIKGNAELKHYAFSLEQMYRYEKYTLSKKEEEIISVMKKAFGTGSEAYAKLDNADIDLGKIVLSDGKKVDYNPQLYMSLIRSSNRALRKKAMQQMYKYYENRKGTISQLYAGTVKENNVLSKLRGYNSALEKSLYADNIAISVYQNLIAAAHKNVFSLQKYMEVKRKKLGLKQMHMYDIYANPEFKSVEHIEFNEAREMLNKALKPLGEKYIEDLQKSYTENWIDIYPNKGKRSGAYQWGPYRLPFVSLNYDYKIEDVSTLAHELGHAMHTYYSDVNQSPVYNAYPIFLAEIASTVNEVLLSDYLLKNAKTKEEKMKYLFDFLEKTRATIYRQVMFAEFEMKIHEMEENGTSLTQELLCNTYRDLNKLYFGEKIVSDDYIQYEWMRIPHFYNPFYVYKYATGLASAFAIATDILNNVPGTREKYLEFLASGASKYPLETLKNAGVDLETGEAIEKAFALFAERVNELELIILDNKTGGAKNLNE